MSMCRIAIIPARSGSKRIPNKNVRLLQGVPLIVYSVRTAAKSGLFDEIIVSTDSNDIAEIAHEAGAKVPSLRPKDISGDSSSDIEWMMHAMQKLIRKSPEEIEFIATLRPTNPLRTADSIAKAMELIKKNIWADSLRALKRVSEHPGKMWIVNESNEALPFMEQSEGTIATYDSPTQTLPKLWVQDASLEVARPNSIISTRSISGNRVISFEMPGYEGFDLNTESDWQYLEYLVEKKLVSLPQ